MTQVPDGLDVDEGNTKDPLGHVADDVVKVGEHVERFSASEMLCIKVEMARASFARKYKCE
jgi:hypothetical protein